MTEWPEEIRQVTINIRLATEPLPPSPSGSNVFARHQKSVQGRDCVSPELRNDVGSFESAGH